MSTTAHLLALMLLGQAPIVGPSPANPARINTDPAKALGTLVGHRSPTTGRFNFKTAIPSYKIKAAR
jgi:hypothetical protein